MKKVMVAGLVAVAWGLCVLGAWAEEAASAAVAEEAVAEAEAPAADVVQVTEVEGSGLIGRIGYDAEKQVAYVQMLYSTDWYGYEGVPPEVFEAFRAAESKGAFFNTQLKGKYPTRRWEW